MADLYENPMGLMGFEFIEFASPTPGTLEPIFEIMGFTKVATHRSKNVHLYRQGAINLILNNEPHSVASYFAAEHGPSVCGMAFRVKDSQKAYNRALELGATNVNAGTVRVTDIGALNSATSYASVVFATGGRLEYSGAGQTWAKGLLNNNATSILAAEGSGALVLNTNIGNFGTGAKTFALGGSSQLANELTGIVTNNTVGAGLTKLGSGTWQLTSPATTSAVMPPWRRLGPELYSPGTKPT